MGALSSCTEQTPSHMNDATGVNTLRVRCMQLPARHSQTVGHTDQGRVRGDRHVLKRLI
jgi:hypothetical protein